MLDDSVEWDDSIHYNEKQDSSLSHRFASGGKSNSSSSRDEDDDDLDAIERASIQVPGDDEEKASRVRRNSSLDLKRTASNVLSKVASRLTTRSIVDPPPAPDGGLKVREMIDCDFLIGTNGILNRHGRKSSWAGS